MQNKPPGFFLKFFNVIKNIVFSFMAIFILACIVAGVSIGGWWVISNVSIEWALVASFAVATLIFVLWKGVHSRLKKTDKLKSEFITIAAHKIRTPLTRIRWMISEIAVETGLGENNPLILSMGEMMEELILSSNKLLSAAEAGKSSLYYDYVFERGSIEILIRQVIAEYTVGAIQKDIGIKVDISENIPETSFDKERMKTAFGIFIENAIIYTQKGGNINIKVFIKRKNIIFSIIDNGIGISKDSLPFIFSKFFRTKDAVSIDRDRAGLGLFIAREIVMRHGGKVGVTSKGKGHGSNFWISIPIK